MCFLGVRPQFDGKDEEIRLARQASLDALEGPRVGDFVDFACGKRRRVSHVWDVEPVRQVQTSDQGSYYLGDGYVSFSGALHREVPADALTLTEERRRGRVWFFHHDWAGAGHGVDSTVEFRVFKCSMEAP